VRLARPLVTGVVIYILRLEDNMAILITQARFTKGGLNEMITAPEDRVEALGQLITEVGGKLIACYFTSGDYDILLVFEGRSYEEVAPALIVAAAGSSITDLKTVTALTASEMKSAFVKAGSIAASDHSRDARAAGRSATKPDLHPAGFERERKLSEAQEDAEAASAILDARKKAMEDVKAGRPTPYYFAPPTTAPSPTGATPPSTDNKEEVKSDKH
jgi:uncharacterized protein with GYD domain